jgi:integration host factor subunit beta
MNKSDLIKKISDNTDSLNEEDLEQTVNIILKLISNSLNNGDRVEIRNFGTFSVRSRDQRISRNPKTGTSVLVEPKNHPYFRASKFLRESLNK